MFFFFSDDSNIHHEYESDLIVITGVWKNAEDQIQFRVIVIPDEVNSDPGFFNSVMGEVCRISSFPGHVGVFWISSAGSTNVGLLKPRRS